LTAFLNVVKLPKKILSTISSSHDQTDKIVWSF